MTQDDAPTGSGLPEDAGNGMSDRSGYTGESGSGMTDTPVATSNPAGDSGTSAPLTETGTTFGTGGDDKGM